MDHMPPRINLPAVLPHGCRAGAAPHPARARAERLPGRRRPGRRQGRSLPGPGPGGHRQRRTDHRRGAGPWICDALLSNHSVKAYGRDLMDFLRHMQAQGVDPLEVTADHVKLYKRALLEAGMDLGHGGPAAVGPPRRLQAAGGQGTGPLGDGPGHRRGQGPRRAEELHTVLDPAAGHCAPGGDPDRHLAGDPRPGPDERVLPHRLPGLGRDWGLRGTPGDRWRRALPPRDREAEQEAAEDPARRGPAGPGLRRASGHRGRQGGPLVPAHEAGRHWGWSGGTWTARPPGGS